MSTFSHHPSTGQKLLARLSSLSLRSDHRSKSYSPSHRRRKQHRPRFETVLEPEEYILGLGKRLDEMHTASPVVKVSKSAGNPRISDCSTLVGVPNSPLDHEDYGHLPVKYKITNPDEPIMHFIELDGVPEPQACDKLWEVLAPQISETDGTISLKSTVNDNGVELHGYCEVSARPSLMGTGLPAAAQSLPPYPMTPPPDPEADPRREVMPTALCDRYRQQPQPSPSHLPPIHPPAITTVLSPAVPSTTYAHTEIPPSLRPGGGRMEPVMPQEPHLARHFDRSCSPREPGVLVGTSTARPPVPSKPKTFRPSAENESSTLPPLRRPLQSSFPKDHYRRPRSYKSPDDVSQGFSPAFKESREHRPQEARQSHRDPLSHTRSGNQARRGPPVPPKRFNTVIDSRRLPGPATTYQGDPRSKLHKRQETRSDLVAPCLEPLVPQLSADINANDYETLIRGLAGKEVYGTSTTAKDPRKSRHQRHTAHEHLPRTGNYLEPNAGASTKRNSRSDVSLGKLEDEIRTSCHVPTSKSSEDVQDILDKAGIPPLVRAVAAAYPVLACALVNARNVAAEKDKDVTFSSTLAVVGGSSRDRRNSDPAMPSARDGAAYGAEGISTKDFGPETTTPSHHHKSTLVLSELTLLPERSSSKGKDKAMDVLAIPGSWSFDNVASPANVPEARTKTSSPASARQSTSQSKRSPTIQRTCDACAEDLSIMEFSSYTLTSACGHENSACRPCVQHWIEIQLDDKMWNRITCMQCPEVLAYADIRRHATTETLARYDYLATRALLSEDENFKWCLGPGCESGQVHEGGNAAPLFVCEACGYRFCVIHEEPHEGETCGQYEARLNGEPFEPSDHMEATGSAQVDVEARRQQEARDLAKAQALHGRYKREEAVRQSELREARERARRAHKQAQADQIAADEETARDIQAELNGEPRDKKRTSAWVEQQREAQTRQAARDEALAREVERMEAEQHARDRVEAAARQQLRERMEQKAQEKKAQDQKALEKAQLVAQRAAEEKARLAAARAKETAQKKAAAKKAADDLVAKRKRREEEIAGAATVRQVSKQCPSCNWSIQKSQGCNHMTCWKCKHEFCYECLADHKEILRNDNSRHKKSCGYYA